jgi:hypothetical protein
MQDGIEKELLKEIAKRMVVKKEELVEFVKSIGGNPNVLAKVAQSLYTQGLIIYVTPIGQTCYAITQRGMREALK